MRLGSEIRFVSSRPAVPPEAERGSFSIESLDNGRELKRPSRWADWTIDQAAFDELIHWLDPDPEVGGQKYEIIRRRLIMMFRCRGCAFPDDLADETFNRVARKLPQIRPYYTGNPAKYFYGVAKRVCLESRHRMSDRNPPPAPAVEEDLEELLERLDVALNRLRYEDRELILNYYSADGRSKIDRRKALCGEMGLDPNALRMRVYRIKAQLRDYLIERSQRGVPPAHYGARNVEFRIRAYKQECEQDRRSAGYGGPGGAETRRNNRRNQGAY